MTKIEWTDDSWNPIRARDPETGAIGWHCVKVSPGCANCYAERRNSSGFGGLGTKRGYTIADKRCGDIELFLDEKTLTAPLRWRKPRRVFVCSMTDLFGDWVSDEWIDRIFAVMALSPQHTFQVLTKRAERMRTYLSDESTQFRVAKACDALQAALAAPTKGAESKRPIEGFVGYEITDRGRVLSARGSSVCVYCGGTVDASRAASARYCSKLCRSRGQYLLRQKKPLPFPGSPAEMSPDIGADGHERVMLYRPDGGTERHLVHRLVLLAFMGKPPAEDSQACHIDGNPRNNALPNLRWGSQSENWEDRKRHGNFRSYSKLSTEQVSEIRHLVACGHPAARIASRFGVSDTQVRNIAKGDQWATRGVLPWPLPSVWIGVSAEDQKRLDERVPHLLETPASVRFLSLEPLLGPIDASIYYYSGFTEPPFDDLVHWTIVGGESGPSARPPRIEWFRDIARHAQEAKVPLFLKQLGPVVDFGDRENPKGWPRGTRWKYGSSRVFIHGARLQHSKGGNPEEWPDDLRIRQWPKVPCCSSVSARSSGKERNETLGGKHNEDCNDSDS